MVEIGAVLSGFDASGWSHLGSGFVGGIVVLRAVAVEGALAINCCVLSRVSDSGVAGTGKDDTGCGSLAGIGQRCCMRSSSSVNAVRRSRKVVGAEEQGKDGGDSGMVSMA